GGGAGAVGGGEGGGAGGGAEGAAAAAAPGEPRVGRVHDRVEVLTGDVAGLGFQRRHESQPKATPILDSPDESDSRWTFPLASPPPRVSKWYRCNYIGVIPGRAGSPGVAEQRGFADGRDRPKREPGAPPGRQEQRTGRASLAGAGQLPGRRSRPLLPRARRLHQGGQGRVSGLRGPSRLPRVRPEPRREVRHL